MVVISKGAKMFSERLEEKYRFDDLYIVEITKNLVDSEKISELAAKKVGPKGIFEELTKSLAEEIKKMNFATLAEIASFAENRESLSDLWGCGGTFIRETGVEEVLSFSPTFFEDIPYNLCESAGEIILETLVVATISCIVWDIINQDRIQEDDLEMRESEWRMGQHF